MSDRLRNFFRIRGKTSFVLDEVVAPVVIVQDLTRGPYQAGVTPCAGTITWDIPALVGDSSVNIMLNDKLGSVIPDLGANFLGRSFSITWLEIQQAELIAPELLDIIVLIQNRTAAVPGTINNSEPLFSILENDGSLSVPVEMFGMDTGAASSGSFLWRTFLGANINVLGAQRQYEPSPNLTLGPNDSLVVTSNTAPAATQRLRVSIRGFYQQQPS